MTHICTGYFLLLLYETCLIVSTQEPGCKSCECCVDQRCERKFVDGHYVNEYCTRGCIAGFSGNKCYNKCPDECLTCEQRSKTTCKSCVVGKYLSSGSCSDCNERCKTCTSASPCQECISPYYNDGDVSDCSLSCPPNCLCLNIGICSACKQGFFGINDKCLDPCPNNCKTCTSNSNCQSCEDGFYIGDDNKTRDCTLPCPDTCSQCSSENNCTYCITGWYGSICESKCSVGCVNGQCSIEDGTCTCRDWFAGIKCDKCKSGRYGEVCNETCTGNCKDNICERTTGYCIECTSTNIVGDLCDRCVTGKWNSDCTSECPTQCGDEGVCQRFNGSCNSCTGNFFGDKCDECIVGYHGSECNIECPENCEDSICHQSNGTCLNCKNNFSGSTCNECVAGWYGQDCNLSCPSQNCHEKICERNTGECISCKTGFYGSLCQFDCSSGCNNGSCNFANGSCSGCLSAYSGDMCCIKDGNGHFSTCSSNSVCNKCINGFYGTNCSKPCPANCSKDERELYCQQISGTCSACDIGFYGDFCDQKCSAKCSNSRCVQSSGHCEKGCTDDNFEGPFCTKAVKQKGGNDIAPMVGGGAAAAIVIIFIVVVIVVFRRRGYVIIITRKGTLGKQTDPNIEASYVNAEIQSASPERGHVDVHISDIVQTKMTHIGAGYFLLLLYETSLIVSTIEPGCEDCGCCVDQKCDTKFVDGYYENEYCTRGCIAGISGNKCYNKCPDQCLTCEQRSKTTCKSCVEGKYLNSGSCSDCNERCKTCRSASQCQECISPYYNDGDVTDCSLHCPPNCLCLNIGICSACKQGFFGINDKCLDPCPNNCKTCTSNSNCQSCEDGFYIGDDNKTRDCTLPCPDTCSQCSSENNCTYCITGWYGSICESKCSVGCVNGQCSIEDGTCTCRNWFVGIKCDKCKSGRYGEVCNETCTGNCKDNVCERTTGNCTECTSTNIVGDLCNRCVTGKWNSDCTSECPTQCGDEGVCQRFNGNCNSCKGNFFGDKCDECIVGYHGSECNLECPENCEDSICHQSNGTCLICKNNFSGSTCNECVAGWYGQDCNLSCPSQNYHEKICERNTGDCISCKTGFYGSLCQFDCSPGCNNGSCDFANGSCSGCLSAYSGDMCCIKDENGHCSTCSSNSVCNKCVNGFYGMNCSKPCPANCSKDERELYCQQIGGTCSACDIGFYGDFCDQKCSAKCSNSRCVQSSGHCEKGCTDDNFEGPFCTTAVKQKGGSDIAPMVGGGAAAAIVIIFIVVVIVVFRRRRTNTKRHEGLTEDSKQSVLQLPGTSSKRDEVLHPVAHGQDAEYENVASISVSGFEAYVRKKAKADYSQEFAQLPSGIAQSCKDARREENVVKNRYKGVYPYDHSRVKLKGDPKFFINACNIDGSHAPNCYIASLGPTETATDNFNTFWTMVWHVNSDVIVMLTNLREPSGNKCDQYWPNLNSTNTHEDITVSCRSIEVFAEYTVRTLIIEKKGKKRTVYQYHYTAWPDKSIPDEVTSLVEFRQRVRSAPRALTGPVIVHCSAGIGRTGTYIALDRLTESGEAGERINVYDCVNQMRQQRVNMVQTLEQYEFLHKALVHTLTFNSGAIPGEQFGAYIREINDCEVIKNFKLLSTKIDEESQEELEARRTNGSHGDKNRKESDIPGDRYRPRLYICRRFGSTDYINAVFVNGFKKKNQYIITQSPLPETVFDFICLIYQESCYCVVSMEDPDLIGTEIGDYLGTDNQVLTCGNFTLKASRCEPTPNYVLRKLNISSTDKNSAGEKVVYHYQMNNWKNSEAVPGDVRWFTQCVKDVSNKAGDMMTEHAPILVHCLNGAERSGLFCAVGVLLEKIDAEGQVSVPNTLRQLRARRKLSIPNKEQFKFCYRCVEDHLDLYNTYANFAQQ